MKHAVMIMAHANWEGLLQLIGLLDSKDVDIYVHINSSSVDWDAGALEGVTTHSKVVTVPRVRVTYCNYSQVEAIKSLLSTAIVGHYDYYHIISGADLPLHTMNDFKSFFEEHNGYEFVNFDGKYDVRYAGYKFFFRNTLRTTNGIKQKAYYKLYKFLFNIQKALKVNLAKGYKGEPKKGADWWSITHKAAAYVMANEPAFKRYFRHTYCPSELLVQTILYNSPFRDKIYSLKDEPTAALREIDWLRGQPYVWRTGDFEYLVKSPCMFARKFDANVDSEIITKIINHLHKQ